MAGKPWCTIQVSGLSVKIDKEDLKRVQNHSWRAIKSSTGRYKVITSIRTKAGSRNVTLGKFLMDPPRGKQVYPRRFQEGLDYRKGNLVVCTMQERQRLLPKRRVETTSKYRGVSFQQASRKWRAGIEVEGRAINLGEYKTETDAALAYNKAALKYFGKIAYQNSIGRKKIER